MANASFIFMAQENMVREKIQNLQQKLLFLIGLKKMPGGGQMEALMMIHFFKESNS